MQQSSPGLSFCMLSSPGMMGLSSSRCMKRQMTSSSPLEVARSYWRAEAELASRKVIVCKLNGDGCDVGHVTSTTSRYLFQLQYCMLLQ